MRVRKVSQHPKGITRKCKGCGRLLILERQGKTTILHHEAPECPYFAAAVKRDLPPPDETVMTVIDKDSAS